MLRNVCMALRMQRVAHQTVIPTCCASDGHTHMVLLQVIYASVPSIQRGAGVNVFAYLRLLRILRVFRLLKVTAHAALHCNVLAAGHPQPSGFIMNACITKPMSNAHVNVVGSM